MKNIARSRLIALLLAVPVAAIAQISLPSMLGMSKGSANSGVDLVGQQSALVSGFVGANKDVLIANAKMAEALGLKNQAIDAQASADALGKGATDTRDLDATNKVANDTGGAVAAALAKKPVLDAAAKSTFSLGLVSLASGSIKYAALGKGVKDMASGLSSASPMDLPKLQSASFIVSKFPESASNLTKALKGAVDFAKNNGIEVPANANDALSALGKM